MSNVEIHQDDHADCAYCAAGEGMEHNPEPTRSLADLQAEYSREIVAALAEIPWRF